MRRWSYVLAVAGGVAALSAAGLDPSAAAAAASQVWPAFVLVAGLLLVGLVAAADGLFEWAGSGLARVAGSDGRLFAGVAGLVAVVTAVLNLDTSVAFIAPVLVHTTRRGRRPGGPGLLSLCLLMSNAGSLLLPGSNLTNLIVLGRHHMSGSHFLARMALPWLAAVVVTAAVAAWFDARPAGRPEPIPPLQPTEPPGERRPVAGAGLAAIGAVVALVLAVGSPALPVLAVGVLAAGWALARGRIGLGSVRETIDLPVLAGLFGLAVGLGALGRAWEGPARVLSHLDPWGTAAAAALSTVLVNNLPASSLLSARPPVHPLSLLIGLNLGPNLFVSGSLAWVLWHASARAAGGRPDVWHTVRVGVVATVLAVPAAEGALMLAGHLT